jgi:hypothetical protein
MVHLWVSGGVSLLVRGGSLWMTLSTNTILVWTGNANVFQWYLNQKIIIVINWEHSSVKWNWVNNSSSKTCRIMRMWYQMVGNICDLIVMTLYAWAVLKALSSTNNVCFWGDFSMEITKFFKDLVSKYIILVPLKQVTHNIGLNGYDG